MAFAEQRTEQEGIHVNVTRTRVSILGFSLTLIIFSISVFGKDSNLSAQGFLLHLTTLVPHFLGIIFAFVSIWLFLISQNLDPEGKSGVWLFAFAEVMMYITFSQALSGIIQNVTLFLMKAYERLPQVAGGQCTVPLEIKAAADQFFLWIYRIGAVVWLILIYFAPVESIHNNPLPWTKKWVVLAFYLGCLLFVFMVSAQAYYLKALGTGESANFYSLFCRQFFEPVLWRT